MERLINNYFELCAKMKSLGSEEYEEKFKNNFMTCIFEMQQDIKMGKLLKQKIYEVKENSKKLWVLQNEQVKHLTNAENLKTEINYRFKSLSKKFDLEK